jgi:hypothetical protein
VRKPEGKRPLREPRRRWADDIEIGLEEIEWMRILTGLVWLMIRSGGELF